MTLDTSAWKINDPEWVKQREEKWPIFEAWIASWYSQFDLKENQDLAKNISNSRRFFFEGFLNVEYENGPNKVGHEIALALVPVLNADIFKDLTNYYFNFCGRYDLKNNFRGYFLNFDRYRELIKNNGVPHDFMLRLLRSAYGNSLTEAAKILEFDVEKVCLGLFKNLSDKILLYYVFGNSSFNGDVARFMLPFYLETITWLKDEDEQECDFYFNTMIEIKKEEYDLNAVSDINRVEFMKDFIQSLKLTLVNARPWVNKKLLPLFE